MNQIKWRYLNTCSFELLRADFMRTMWNEDVANPAYPDDTFDFQSEDDDQDTPDNVNFSRTSYVMGGVNYTRGVSGYIFEKLEFNNKNSMQALFWERFCDLADSIHRFTIGYNNDYWHEYPEDEDEDEDVNDKAYEEYYEERYEDMMALEENIIALSRTASKSQKEQDSVCYDRVIKFINSKDSYVATEWADIDDWNKAQSILLKQLELFFCAVGPDPFFASYLDTYLPKQTAEHLDWRINPILRDIYLGFLTRNPFLIDMDKKILDDTQLLDLLFRNPDKPFPGALELKQFNGKDVLHMENFDKLLENKYKVSMMFYPDYSYKEIENKFKDGSLRSDYLETD